MRFTNPIMLSEALDAKVCTGCTTEPTVLSSHETERSPEVANAKMPKSTMAMSMMTKGLFLNRPRKRFLLKPIETTAFPARFLLSYYTCKARRLQGVGANRHSMLRITHASTGCAASVNASCRSSILSAPSATQSSGLSSTRTGIPVSWASSLLSPRSSALPPVSVMPLQ